MMHDREKSDSAIVAVKPANKVGQPTAEPMEPRAEAEGNASQQRTRRAQDRESVSQALERIRAGLKAAEARGRKGGRKPVVGPDKLRRAQTIIGSGLTVREAATRLRIGKTALYEALRKPPQIERSDS